MKRSNFLVFKMRDTQKINHKKNKSIEDKEFDRFVYLASESALKEVWDNPKEDEVWSKY